MATTNREKLFTEFPPVTTEQWEEVITADLKGADYERKLVWRTPEGFNVRPYYRAENLEGIEHLSTEAGQFPYVRGTRNCNCWGLHQTLKVECPAKANAEALKILNAGVDSLEFRVSGEEFTAEYVDTLLAGIELTAIELTFSGCKLGKVAELVLDKVEKMGLDKEAVRLNFVIDPIIKSLSVKGQFCSEKGAACFEKISGLVKRVADYKRVRIVTVSGETFSNAGSTIVEELAFTLAAGHEYLVRLMENGLTIDEAARKVRFSMGVTANYFMEMAKFRAARMLWANIVKAYNPECECSCKMYTHAVTSAWNQTVYDPYVNMLRGTTEAMSATIAGVNTLEVLPFNAAFEAPTEFSQRIARNVELLLKHESHFDQVVDPAGGSYYI
ncbi:MAG: acyl-CoA mutase large subunit family protein, partial [Alistipes sp.]|nr:acyl-CoA mutase large subunit family protein [Alistipes sp.]